MKVRREYIVAQREKANVVLAEALIEKFSDHGSYQYGG
jgi:hypothetical protein